VAVPPEDRVRSHANTTAVRHSRHPLDKRIQRRRSHSRSCGRLTARFKAATC
jgi:hypothetical protein